MRVLLLLALAALPAAGADFRPYPVRLGPTPRLPPLSAVPVGDLSPAGHTRLAARDLATNVRAPDRPYTFYVSLYDQLPEEAAQLQVLCQLAVNLASQGPTVRLLEAVEGSAGYLLRGDRRHYCWTRAALSAVARRDPAFTDKSAPVREAEFLRASLGIPQDPRTLSVEAVLTGSFLVRAILQPDGHDATYYDLLYAVQRFGPDDTARVVVVVPDEPGPEPPRANARPWRGGPWPGDGIDYPEGAFQYVPAAEEEAANRLRAAWRAAKEARAQAIGAAGRRVEPGKRLRDFPATGQEFAEFWGADAVKADAAGKGRLVVHGEVVAGARNHPKGSYVAANDRVFVVVRIGTGYYLETFDSDFTRLQFDYLENPLGAARQKVEKKAGEILAHQANGGQAMLLVNAADARVDSADARIARNTFDAVEPVVLTGIGCVQCHLGQLGYVKPTNRKLRDFLERGGKLDALRDPAHRDEVEAFALGWEELEADIATPTRIFLRQCTAPRRGAAGWTGPEAVAAVTAFRDRYDQPVKLGAAARMLGVPEDLAFLALSFSPKAGANLVATEGGMPRYAWDATGWAEALDLVSLFRPYYRDWLNLLGVPNDP